MKKSKKKNQIYVVLSTSIVLFFIGLYVLGIFHASGFVKVLKEQVNHVVELGQDAEKTRIMASLQSNPQILSSSVKYLDKREALQIMAQEIDPSLISNEDNPFLDVILFRSTADADIPALHKEITAVSSVNSVYTQDLQLDQIKSNFYKIAWIFLIAAGIFSLLAMALIFSTLQLQLYSDRFELKTMELVGAQDRFIKMPYLRRAVNLGTKATINASVFLILIFMLIKYGWSGAESVMSFVWLIVSIVIIWILGILFLWFSSNLLIQKYLTTRMNDLYT